MQLLNNPKVLDTRKQKLVIFLVTIVFILYVKITFPSVLKGVLFYITL